MSLETGLISFAAMTSLALAMRKHRVAVALPLLPPTAAAHVMGWALLTLAAAVAIAQLGFAFGLTAWIGQTCVAAPLLILLMSWRPQFTPAVAGLALACALLLDRL